MAEATHGRPHPRTFLLPDPAMQAWRAFNEAVRLTKACVNGTFDAISRGPPEHSGGRYGVTIRKRAGPVGSRETPWGSSNGFCPIDGVHETYNNDDVACGVRSRAREKA